jgi:glycosyltransferase involved in cell wall biosynthesis
MDRLVAGDSAARGPDRHRVAYYMDAHAWPGGAEVWLSRLIHGLAGAGWQVSLFLSDRRATDGWAAELEALGVAVTRFRPMREVDVAGAREARRHLAGSSLVHFNKVHPRSLLPAIRAARTAGARAVVSTEHVVLAPASRYPLGELAVSRLVGRANRSIDVITTTSEQARREYIESYRVAESKVVNLGAAVPVGAPVDSRSREATRRELGFGPEHLVGAMVGRLHEGKGIETAIAAVPDVLSRVPHFRLLLVGSGPLEGELRGAAAAAPAGAVVFAGTRSDVPAVMAAADLFLSASESETAGLTVLEAMAAGLPVVATGVGGVVEAVEDGVTGILIPPRDRSALADAVVSVASSPDRGGAMGAGAREVVRERFSTERLVRRVGALYERLLGGAEEEA